MEIKKYNVMISYDVNGKQDEVKEGLKKIGYRDNFVFENQTNTNYLPATTLVKWNTDVLSVKNEMLSVCSNLKVKLERFVATKFDVVSAIQGEPYKS